MTNYEELNFYAFADGEELRLVSTEADLGDATITVIAATTPRAALAVAQAHKDLKATSGALWRGELLLLHPAIVCARIAERAAYKTQSQADNPLCARGRQALSVHCRGETKQDRVTAMRRAGPARGLRLGAVYRECLGQRQPTEDKAAD